MMNRRRSNIKTYVIRTLVVLGIAGVVIAGKDYLNKNDLHSFKDVGNFIKSKLETNYPKIEIGGVEHILCDNNLYELRKADITEERGIDQAVIGTFGSYNTPNERAITLKLNKEKVYHPGDEIVYAEETDKVDHNGTSRPKNFSLYPSNKNKIKPINCYVDPFRYFSKATQKIIRKK